MHTLLSTRLTRAALTAARPARRRVVRALRHHSARTRALTEQWRDARPVDSVRTWFRTFFSTLRMQGASRRFSLRTLLLRRPTPLRVAGMAGGLNLVRGLNVARGMSRKPRRTSTTSTGWFAFAR
ncbi:hypothetical protein [Paraburkholderia humisilvae]|uniref:Uncharacterized protein n=1 Tax=Paraburkholderia humisilvae TaxID=627669 RepID=A0A6J5DIA5_9BURK|nr:hypothetical protein [Paraburkholderia humisilvae]CAB3752775.1 hypothetical protein LMG29542_01885 [Paraburkholderia humisilvae]